MLKIFLVTDQKTEHGVWVTGNVRHTKGHVRIIGIIWAVGIWRMQRKPRENDGQRLYFDHNDD